MTREIKFRAWDEESSIMIYPGEFSHDGFYLECCDDGKPFLMLSPNDEMDDGFSHPEHREKSAIMQYTGLKDKNGKEIYEGDVVTSEVTSHDWVFGDLTDKQIKDNFKTFVMNDIFDSTWLKYRESLDVIGNIYENPELLEAKND